MCETCMPCYHCGMVPVRHPHVEIDPAVCGGRAHVRGTRIPVHRLWTWHRSGCAIAVLIKRYPNIGPAAVLDALSFAYDNPSIIERDIATEASLREAMRFVHRCC